MLALALETYIHGTERAPPSGVSEHPPPQTYPDPDNPGCLLGCSEVEHRTDYIHSLCEQLVEQHTFLQLVCQCLDNEPAQRPSTEELLQQLEAVS